MKMKKKLCRTGAETVCFTYPGQSLSLVQVPGLAPRHPLINLYMEIDLLKNILKYFMAHSIN